MAMNTLPDGLSVINQTPEFDQDSVPAALLSSHKTKPGVWGRINVLEGELVYRILEPEVQEFVLSKESKGVVTPEVPHEVKPKGDVRFFVQFLK